MAGASGILCLLSFCGGEREASGLPEGSAPFPMTPGPQHFPNVAEAGVSVNSPAAQRLYDLLDKVTIWIYN